MSDDWQHALTTEALAQLSADPEVAEVWLIGSLARVGHQPDSWTDVDLGVVVGDVVADRWLLAAQEWIAACGTIWLVRQQARVSGNPRWVRAIFDDGRWLDVALTSDAAALPGPRRRLYPSDGLVAPASDHDEYRALFTGAPDREVILPTNLAEVLFTVAIGLKKLARGDLAHGTALRRALARRCVTLARARLRVVGVGSNEIVAAVAPDIAAGELARAVADLASLCRGLYADLEPAASLPSTDTIFLLAAAVPPPSRADEQDGG